MPSLLLVDSSYLIFRSFFVHPKLSANDFPTGAFFGFAKTVLKAVLDYKIDYICFAGDLPTPTWRHTEYQAYKAGRSEADQNMVKQIPVIQDWCRLVNRDYYLCDGWEADDLIKTFVTQANVKFDQPEIYIFSSDRDLYQLFTQDKVSFVSSEKLFTRQDFIEKYQVQPEQWIDFKTLVGDASDNLIGIAGVGPKTAASILQQIDKLDYLIDYIEKGIVIEAIQAFIENPKNAVFLEKLKLNLVNLKLTKRLATLGDVPNMDVDFVKYDFQKARDMFEKYNFKSLIKELDTNFAGSQALL